MKQITQEEFKALYGKHSIKELAEILDCSRQTIRYNANKLDLPLKQQRLINDDSQE